jgi:hypothetical protein
LFSSIFNILYSISRSSPLISLSLYPLSLVPFFLSFPLPGALGWNEEASEAAVRQCGGNVTSAVEMLEREETAMLDQFETAVKDMVHKLQLKWK